MERETRIPAGVAVPGLEDGLYDGEPVSFPVEQAEPGSALEQALDAAAYIIRYIGGAVTFAAIRREIKPDSGAYVTTEIVMRWHSFVPPVKAEGNGQPVEEPVAATG